MAFRMGGNGNNRRDNRGFERGYGGAVNRSMNPWGENPGNYRQGGGMNNEVLSLANSLVSNILRNQNQVPSLLDLPRGGGGQGYGRDFVRFDDRMNRMGNRNIGSNRRSGNLGGGGGVGGGNVNINNANARLKGVMKGGIRKPNPQERAKKVLAKNIKESKPEDNNSTDKDKIKIERPPAQSGICSYPNPKTPGKGGFQAPFAPSIQLFNDIGMQRNKQHVNNINNHNNNSNKIRPANPKPSGKKEKKESKYADVPNIMFFCHMCKKHMWDAISFENHLKGRTHMTIRENIEHSYSLRANMIRHEAKIEEQLKHLEVDRLRRMGKAMKGSMRREYCTMCDLQFYGHLSAHRKTDGHLVLKKFLHPKCNECAQEFSTRIDYDGHILSPEHMKRTFSTNAGKKELRKPQVVIHTEEDELKDLKEERVKKEEKMETDEATGTDGEKVVAENGEKMESEETSADGAAVVAAGEETVEEGGEEAVTADGADGAAAVGEKKDEKPVKKEPTPEPEDVILDFQDDDEIPVEVDARLPRYNCNRSIATSLIHKLECFECHLCNRFLDTEKTAEIHTRTMTHHRNFVKFLNERANDTKIAQKRAAIAAEEVERRKKRDALIKNGDIKKEIVESGSVGGAAGGDDAYDPSNEASSNVDEDEKSKDIADETMESQDGDEHFEDANATVVKEEPVEVAADTTTVVVKEEEVVKTTPTRTPSTRGRSRGGRAAKAR